MAMSEPSGCVHGLTPITCSYCLARRVPTARPVGTRQQQIQAARRTTDGRSHDDVWVSPGGDCFHSSPGCRSLRSGQEKAARHARTFVASEVTQVDLATAVYAKRLVPCSRCIDLNSSLFSAIYSAGTIALQRRVIEATSSQLRDTGEPTYTLQFQLKAWQTHALSAWIAADHRGVVEAATGSGKTAVGLAAMEHLHRMHGGRLRTAIIVPSKVLARQWRDQLQRNLNIPHSWIGEQYSDTPVEWQPHHTILIAVVNSARTRLTPILDLWKTHNCVSFLIVDECHRAGSEHNSLIFRGDYRASLGLSATPERDDRGHETLIYPGLGLPVYRYPLLDALNDGTVADLYSINLYVDFDSAERSQWRALTEDLGSAFRDLKIHHPELEFIPDEELLRAINKLAARQDPLALRIQKLIAERCDLLSSAQARQSCQRAVLEWLAQGERRALIFHETIKAARASHDYLTRHLGVKAGIDHSRLPREMRIAAMRRFRNERDQVLVAVRALDEGVDVPDASVALIVAGSRSRRQRIQRIGRVLRPQDGKKAMVISILIRNTPEEAAVGARDGSLLGESRVRHHRWPAIPIPEAAQAITSTYAPAEPGRHIGDLLTMVKLGMWEPKGPAANPVQPPSQVVRRPIGSTFGPSGWYRVDFVRDRIGIPSDEFERLRNAVRDQLRHRLDPARVNPSVIHGSEIAAVRRQWLNDNAVC